MINGIIIVQSYEKGLLGGPRSFEGSYVKDNNVFNISINQLGIRQLSVSSNDEGDLIKFWTMFLKLDMLIMLIEGEFVPIESGKVIIGDEEEDNNELSDLISSRVNFYKSADFTVGAHSTFGDFSKLITIENIQKWDEMLEELDILHPMVLYAMADTGITIDCKCAFLIEAFEGLAELVAEKEAGFILPKVQKGESQLGKRLGSLISMYGDDIFQKEKNADIEKVISSFVASRNRIAHIKRNQEKHFLNGKEAVLYSVKLSFLYRIVVLSLLGVDYQLYADKVRTSIAKWDEWEGVLTDFLNAL